MDTIKTNTNVIEKWQSSKKTIKARFNFLFNNEKLSDVHFVVGKNKQHQIPAHKLVLAASSDVFETLFFGSLPESDQIELPDIEPTIFLEFLKFIYTDEIKIDHETVMSTLYVAKKYNVTALEDYCVEFLETNLDCDHAVLLLRQAKFFDEPKLADICLNIIDRNATDVLYADNFNDTDLDTLTELLKRDTLEIKESKLFEAILRWAVAECARKQLDVTPENQRLVLGPVFKLIRFPLMPFQEFANGPVQSGLLTDREVKDLMLNITVNPKPDVQYSDVPRRCEKLVRTEQVLNRFKSTSYSPWIYPDEECCDIIHLKVDRPIFIIGFGIYGPDTYAEFDVDIELKHSVNYTSEVCGSAQNSFDSDGSTSIYKVKFNEPIKITPDTYYEARVQTRNKEPGKVHFSYGGGGQRKVIINDLNGEPITFTFTSIERDPGRTNVNYGQIPEIIFYTSNINF